MNILTAKQWRERTGQEIHFHKTDDMIRRLGIVKEVKYREVYIENDWYKIAKTSFDSLTLRQDLIERGVKSLIEYGYPAVTRDNICSDLIYRAFFRSLLEDLKNNTRSADTLIAAETILKEIKKHDEKDSQVPARPAQPGGRKKVRRAPKRSKG